jgi:hydroxymethylpyrimidine pyrophosphatase-like HAD family hydrolase
LHKAAHTAIRMIALDMDGTLLGEDGKVSPRNLAALHAAEAAAIEIVVATGRRHSYAMRVLRPLGLDPASALVSSNGTVTRTLGAASVATELIARAHLPCATALWLVDNLEEFRNSLVLTFDRVLPDGEDTRGALIVEHLEELHSSIGKWMATNEPYIALVNPIEAALTADSDAPIQMMLCGTVARMAHAEAHLRELGTPPSEPGGRSTTSKTLSEPGRPLSPSQTPGAPSMTASLSWVGRNDLPSQPAPPPITLHRTEYPARDLSILDILPAGCSKGAAILSLAATRNLDPAQILAIGDNWNDISMLEIAGTAVLMDNAPEDLKTFARKRGWQIGPSNAADGVAEAIESALGVPC